MNKIISINHFKIPDLCELGYSKDDFAGILSHPNKEQCDNINKLEGGIDLNQDKESRELYELKEKFKDQTTVNAVLKTIKSVWNESTKQHFSAKDIKTLVDECLEFVKVSFEKCERKKKFFYVDSEGSERQFFKKEVNGIITTETDRHYYNSDPVNLGRFIETKPIFTINNGRFDVQFRVLAQSK